MNILDEIQNSSSWNDISKTSPVRKCPDSVSPIGLPNNQSGPEILDHRAAILTPNCRFLVVSYHFQPQFGFSYAARIILIGSDFKF